MSFRLKSVHKLILLHLDTELYSLEETTIDTHWNQLYFFLGSEEKSLQNSFVSKLNYLLILTV